MHRGLALLVLGAIVLIALYVPVAIPYKIVSIGHVQPAAEWKLMQDGTGNLVATEQNFILGNVRTIASWQFDRGDISGMEISAKPDSSGLIQPGDTLVRMYSSIARQRILQLETEIAQLEAEYSELSTGSKIQVISAAKTRLASAEEALSLREKEWQIADKLFAEGVIAKLEHSTRLNARDLALIEVENAKKELDVVSTGEKVETLQANSVRTTSLRRQLAQLRQQYLGFVVQAPFKGMASPIMEEGQVLILHKTDTFIVQIPVKTSDMRFLRQHPLIQITDAISGKVYPAVLHAKSAKTEIINGQNVSFVQALVAGPALPDRLTIGLGSTCSITCDTLNQREYLLRILNFNPER